MVGPDPSRRPPLPPGPYLVLGLARSGSSVALALRGRGERVVGVDVGIAERRAELEAAGVEVHTGGEPPQLLEGVETVVKSPGVPPTAPLVQAARARGVAVIGELELAWRLVELPIVAVTGTNGKTTTVELIGHIHRTAGVEVAVVGNVGLPLSELIGAPGAAQRLIAEVSSFQLEDASGFAPEVGVLLNISPDHLDRHGTFEAYRAAKLKLFARQRPEDLALLPEQLASELPAGWTRARVLAFGGPGSVAFWRGGTLYHRLHGPAPKRARALVGAERLRLRGVHNRANALGAAATCLALGLPERAVREGLESFSGVPHRLEELDGPDGILYVNDSKATNVASTRVALRAFARPPRDGRIHLILGGRGKGQDFRALRADLKRHVHAVYLIGEDGERIAAALERTGVELHRPGTLERAVELARGRARPGDVVLLSPACASFDQFENYEARGRRFRELVLALR